jgi:hypothetical protein
VYSKGSFTHAISHCKIALNRLNLAHDNVKPQCNVLSVEKDTVKKIDENQKCKCIFGE